MRTERKLEIRVGIFLNFAIILALIAIWILGGSQNLFNSRSNYTLVLPDAEGLTRGSKVMIAGVPAGTVSSFELDPESGNVIVNIEVAAKYRRAIRKDSKARILTEGVLGDRVVSISAGSKNSVELLSGSKIPVHPTVNLNQIFTKGDELLTSLNRVAGHFDQILNEVRRGRKTGTMIDEVTVAAKSLSSLASEVNQEVRGIEFKNTVANLNQILTKINRGSGTLGGLVNDPQFYDDMKALIGQANQNRIVRNLVRKTIEDSEKSQAGTQGISK